MTCKSLLLFSRTVVLTFCPLPHFLSMLANEEHWPKVCKTVFPPLSLPFFPFVPFSRYIGRPPKYNAVLGFGALTPTSPPSSHPDSPENEKPETTFTFPAPVQPVSLPSPTSTDVSNVGKARSLARSERKSGTPLSNVVSLRLHLLE